MPTTSFLETERKRTFQLNLSIGLTGAVFLGVFGVNAFVKHQYAMAAHLLAMNLWGLMFLVAMCRTGNPGYGAFGVSVSATYACGYLIVTGGVDGTGPLWCYPLVVVIMFLMGLRYGSFMVLGLIALFAIVLFVPGLPLVVLDYPFSFRIRFVSSFVALAIMSMIYEFLRGKSQESYQTISAALDATARTDELTGLANRREIRQLLEREFARANRHDCLFSVVMADVDYFKRINDRYGHMTGDLLLIAIAQRFASALRAEDCVARWGGEEFLILLPNTTAEQARLVAEELRKLIAGIDLSEYGIHEPVTASFGVRCSDQAESIDDLVNQADRRLYEAKDGGRNRVV